MKIITTTDGYEVKVDDELFDYLSLSHWCTYARPGCRYAQRSNGPRTDNQERKMHRIITECPSDMQVDHINHDGLDNRRENLRIVNRSQNYMNTRLRGDNSSGIKGVCWDKRDRKWIAYIQGRHIGRFDSLKEAIDCRAEAEIEHFGEFRYKGEVHA